MEVMPKGDNAQTFVVRAWKRMIVVLDIPVAVASVPYGATRCFMGDDYERRLLNTSDDNDTRSAENSIQIRGDLSCGGQTSD